MYSGGSPIVDILAFDIGSTRAEWGGNKTQIHAPRYNASRMKNHPKYRGASGGRERKIERIKIGRYLNIPEL